MTTGYYVQLEEAGCINEKGVKGHDPSRAL